MPTTQNVVTLTRALLALDTINPPGNEAEAIRLCARFLEQAGFTARIVPHGPDRASLIATRGTPDAPMLCFTGHLDTVPLGLAPWTVPPFEGRVDGDRLYGRGSTDMKGAIAAFMLAAARQDTAPGGQLGLVLTAAEETGCEGARWLAKAGALPQAAALIVGEPTDNRPLAGHKGALWLRLTARGRTAHGSMPHLGVNAIAVLAPTLQRLIGFDPAHSHPLMGAATCNIGTLHAGINVNSVPDRCELTLDLRSVPGIGHDDLVRRIQALCDPGIEVDRLIDLPSVWTDPSDPWFAATAARATALTGRKAEASSANYFTDASVLGPAMGNPPVVILGPGAPDQPHGTDEYVLVSRLEEAVTLYAALIADWPGSAAHG